MTKLRPPPLNSVILILRTTRTHVLTPSLTTIINTEAALSPAADLFVQVQQRRSILLGSTKNECNERVRRDGAGASCCGLCWDFMG